MLFDGAYRHNLEKAVGEIIILSPRKGEVINKGITLKDSYSNNNTKYSTLVHGLKECINLGVKLLSIKGDALLVVKQLQGVGLQKLKVI